MRLLLIRHGETVDNVAGNYAGITDSALTAHGAIQASHLAAHLASRFDNIRVLFTSDLQRAARTAAAIREEQHRVHSIDVPLLPTPLLRERDFGILEGLNIRTADPTIRADDVAESHADMRLRAETFLDECFVPEWASWGYEAQMDPGEPVVCVVAHGLFLNVLFTAICARVQPGATTYAADVPGARGSMTPVLPWWSNTAYLDCIVTGRAAGAGSEDETMLGHFPPLRMHIERVNYNEHLRGVKRTGGGIGSAVFDEKQKKIEQFLGGRKL
jgi:broad specificity phosphatase PhoE